jgi:CDP-2,3-bis-(O-geranylgeranyl)-sn-glycerol synthase
MSIPEVLYLFLPAFVANGAPVVARKIPGITSWTTPICVRAFGANKTYRGFAVGVASAIVTALVQFSLRNQWIFKELTELHNSLGQSALVGFLLGFGALFGDLVKSFVKRRIGIAPGQAWPVLDGIDYILGAALFILPLYKASLMDIVVLIVAAPLLSLLANSVSFVLGWKDVWY